MKLKKVVVLGLAGVLATGFGVAGCSGSNDVVDGSVANNSNDSAQNINNDNSNNETKEYEEYYTNDWGNRFAFIRICPLSDWVSMTSSQRDAYVIETFEHYKEDFLKKRDDNNYDVVSIVGVYLYDGDTPRELFVVHVSDEGEIKGYTQHPAEGFDDWTGYNVEL